MKRALLSVTDKTGIVDFARSLSERGFEIVSTGGTAREIRQAGIPVVEVSEVTGFPEMLDGRVKTLHPMIHGGLLGDVRLESHRAAMLDAGIQPIEVVAVNLYAFEKTVSEPHTAEEAIESIDIGGPAMIRAAAKNHDNLFVVVDPGDYGQVLAAIDAEDASIRLSLAAKAFRHTAFYDSMISRYLTNAAGESPYSDTVTVGLRQASPFRYGENPHQRGALYHDPLGQPGLCRARQLWGMEMGYNNWNDADGAWELVADLPGTACAITKHGNPCGAAVAETYGDAFRLARDSDPISAFGGVVAINGLLDEEAAEAMVEKGNKLDVVIATGFTDGALRMFQDRKGWGQEVRLLAAPLPPSEVSVGFRSIRGGALVQDTDEDPGLEWRVVTKLVPSEEQMAALRFLWRVIPHVKSNAIVVGSAGRLRGVGAGQMNRVQSVRLALEQAGETARGGVLASDAFFPFPDSIETAAAAGIAAIVQPGGSKKDPDVIAKADELGIAMCFTGVRHFRH
ncbi:bifunctional phosphoribosylaminoimidazolecarboxamide formyltransferase/IMP cyclohydrolase [Fimbriimonas ginsengisoli]|uniref:Bifunctional purine biosynthesis protein PurH n=1 Tax=Fimbriimonas ginsengisoli Gsoil 348 TaxID=661478 RepID=A0A068NQ21_FIMGI|nr:bifunctional phosphoribosylaminoimidazolecarboxamide formyltransferase/IMP cyclohydrolase [Fimbriimonas ginsengisoli]AIE85643.1 bifunctional phosphoribosylaminoimidazolecarboxamide formyltransferase/IMP cyclohydrolase [Fimbriimonas ginsengisoli Gsoil 348]